MRTKPDKKLLDADQLSDEQLVKILAVEKSKARFIESLENKRSWSTQEAVRYLRNKGIHVSTMFRFKAENKNFPRSQAGKYSASEVRGWVAKAGLQR